MKILLVSATKFEVAPLLKKFKKISSNGNLVSYCFGKLSVDVLVTGIGMTSTALHLGKVLNRKYDWAINAGMAGSFRKNIPIGSVINVTSDCFADFGAEDGNKFLTAEEIGLGQITSYQPQIKSKAIKKNLCVLPQVKGITVNTVHGNNTSIKKVIKKFNPDIESMEGAAFFFACSHEKISCIQIRAVSNYVERRNKKKWEIKIALKNLNIAIETILNSL